MKSKVLFVVAAGLLVAPLSSNAQPGNAPAKGSGATAGSAVGGSAGSAAAGGTSASTVGAGATARGPAGTSAAIGAGGSAAAVEGRARSTTQVRENPQKLQAQSRAAARDGGTWSRSMTHTRVRRGDDVTSWTRAMAHRPGGKPAMSSSRVR